MLTYTEENYIKAIYSLTKSNDKGAATTKISEAIHTKASSVTDMLRRLADKKLIEHKKYQGARLTESGLNIAKNVVRKHRLWEVFLVEKLNFKWDEVHDIAEQLEHIQSKELTDRLDAFLNFPKHDPHGDPIPSANGELPQHSSKELYTCKKNNVVIVKGVKDSSTAFLQYLEKVNIGLNTKIEVLELFEFDESMQVKLDDQKTLHISKRICNNLYIEKIK